MATGAPSNDLLKEWAKLKRKAKKLRKDAAEHVKQKIYDKAMAIKVTGNLAAGVYAKHGDNASFVGIRRPAFHQYLVEFGHYIANSMKFVPGNPIIRTTFDEESQAVQQIMGVSWED
jgi:hypothetical protein